MSTSSKNQNEEMSLDKHFKKYLLNFQINLENVILAYEGAAQIDSQCRVKQLS